MTIDLSAHGYREAGQARLWVPCDTRADFAYNDGDEHETWVADTIHQATDVSTFSREIHRGIRDWPSRYHLSSQRANLLRPVLGSMTGPVLEVGAGMGAVTRILGEHGHEVVAVEGSTRRAAACAERCRDLPGVQVVADAIQGFDLPGQFGTVVVIGVLEYSRVFFPGAEGVDPVDAMLAHVTSLLRPGGQLVLAIENQLGLKYFAGFPEDHLGRPMAGIEDRYRDDTVVTFGREELRRRLSGAGLAEQAWYFPFPDYKLPTAVVSERALSEEVGFDPLPLVAPSGWADHQRPSVTAFEPERAWRAVHRNGLLSDVANSFLVRASRAPLEPSSPAVAWYYGTSARRPEFAKETAFETTGDGLVVRRSRLAPGLPTVVGTVGMELADEPYVGGRPWTDRLADMLARDGWTTEDVAAWLGTWLGAFRQAALADAAGDAATLPGRFVDALPRNLMVRDESSEFIDLEWWTSGTFPLDYAVFRALYDSLASLGTVARPADGTPAVLGDLLVAVAARHGVDLDREALERHWERERLFQATVLGSAVDIAVDDVLAARLRVRRDFDEVVADAAALPGAQATIGTLTSERDVWQGTEVLLREEIERRGAEIERIQSAAAALHEEIRRLEEVQRRAARVEQTLAVEQRARESQGAELRATREQLEDRRRRAAGLERAVAVNAALVETVRREAHALRGELDARRGEVAALRTTVEAIQRTVSWRITGPLRTARSLPRRLGAGPGESRPAVEAAPAGPAVAAVTVETAVPTVPALAGVPADPAAATEPADPGYLAVTTSDDLDVAYYRARNADLAHLDDAGLERHYVDHGRAEGRRPRSALHETRVSVRAVDPARPTVLVLFHEATRTGAPILGWNLLREIGATHNAVAVILSGGELLADVVGAAAATVVLSPTQTHDDFEAGLVVADLVERFSPVFAIANSAATFPVVPALERHRVPVVALVHEFSSSVRPHGVLAGLFGAASEVVFPAEIVAESMRRDYADLLGRRYRIIPQGQSQLPGGEPGEVVPRPRRGGTDGVTTQLPERSTQELLADLDPSTVLVIGAGTLSPRKGIEFFVQAANQVAALAPGAAVHFAWIGHRIDPLDWYVDELWEQVTRSGAEDRVTFLSPAPDLAPLYDRADLLFLSSRLDPLPNVTIDAALAGIPVVAFDQASGMSEWLAGHEGLRPLVVPHLDAAAAASRIAELAVDGDARRRYGDELRAAAQDAFSMPCYAAALVELGHAARVSVEQAGVDVAQILTSGQFSLGLYAGDVPESDLARCVTEYVHRSRLAVPRARPRTGMLVRRPREGFNPLVYAEQQSGYVDERDGDPFADHLRRGSPDGPWARRVIGPDDAVTGPAPAALRTLVHGHFHYPELVGDLLARLVANERTFEAAFTTSSADSVRLIRASCERFGLPDAQVLEVPNRGRDLAPLVTGLGVDLLERYDLVLHVHGKKSPHVDASVSDRWRDFLWESLVGGKAPMLDVVHDAFAADPRLGLVSAEDPHLNDWDLNRPAGEALAARIGLTAPLTTHFDFPIGTMFWARTDALRTILEARLEWDEYPPEPLPIDGTMLHALERLVPFAVAERGYTSAAAVVPGVSR